MKYLQKTWVRILVSLLAASMISEIIFISTGDPNRSRENESPTLLLLMGVAIYFVLTNRLKKIK